MYEYSFKTRENASMQIFEQRIHLFFFNQEVRIAYNLSGQMYSNNRVNFEYSWIVIDWIILCFREVLQIKGVRKLSREKLSALQ